MTGWAQETTFLYMSFLWYMETNCRENGPGGWEDEGERAGRLLAGRAWEVPLQGSS